MTDGTGGRTTGDVPIGELARRVGISTRTLRHYDAIGLLQPTRTDHAGQRFYDDQAVAVLLRIVAYRDLGMSSRASRNSSSDRCRSVHLARGRVRIGRGVGRGPGR
jgi:hypothetical protein